MVRLTPLTTIPYAEHGRQVMMDPAICWPATVEEATPSPSRRVLMLAYFFPPHSAVAAHRPEALFRYLPEFGWTPTVITATGEGADPAIIRTPDIARLRGMHGGVPAGKAPGRFAPLLRTAKKLLRYFPPWRDEYASWSNSLFAHGVAAAGVQHIDLVWATCNPFSLAPAAIRLAQALGVPCVVDLRDTFPAYLTHTTPARHWFYQAIREADVLTLSAPANATSDLLQARTGRRPTTIVSGMWLPEVVPASPVDTFRIFYAGALYSGTRDIRPLLTAMRDLAGELPEFRTQARLQIVGGESAGVALLPEYRDVAEMCELVGALPHRQVEGLMAEASVLTIIKGSGFEHEDALPAKFFDYLPYAAPIVAFGGISGLLGDFLRWSRSGVWMSTADELTVFLRTHYQAWCNAGIVIQPRLPAALEYFTQRRMAGEFAAIFTALADGRAPSCRERPLWQEVETK